MALRTPGMGGFQLLDLQDYPGQGTALVGILDAFLDNKGLISPEDFRMFCSQVVPLLLMDRFCWSNRDSLIAEIKIANYGPATLKKQKIEWSFNPEGGEFDSQSGILTIGDIPQGQLTSAGKIEISLGYITIPTRASIYIRLEGSEYRNEYPVWIYPADMALEIPENVFITTDYSSVMLDSLNNGARVLFFPDLSKIQDVSVGGMFIPDFWNYKMFKSLSEQYGGGISPGTMGILTDAAHPIFNLFPTDNHTEWQWWPIVKNSRPVMLDKMPEDYLPVVQVIDNINRNYKLGLIFEFRVGKGKILICSSELKNNSGNPEALQLYKSILAYVSGSDFDPLYEISPVELGGLLGLKKIR
jgi:hypothetical protein